MKMKKMLQNVIRILALTICFAAAMPYHAYAADRNVEQIIADDGSVAYISTTGVIDDMDNNGSHLEHYAVSMAAAPTVDVKDTTEEQGMLRKILFTSATKELTVTSLWFNDQTIVNQFKKVIVSHPELIDKYAGYTMQIVTAQRGSQMSLDMESKTIHIYMGAKHHTLPDVLLELDTAVLETTEAQ